MTQVGTGDPRNDVPVTVGQLQQFQQENTGNGPTKRQRRLSELDPDTADLLRCHLRNPTDHRGGWKFFARMHDFAEILITDIESHSGDPAEDILSHLHARFPSLTVLEFCEQLQAPECKGEEIIQLLKSHIWC